MGPSDLIFVLAFLDKIFSDFEFGFHQGVDEVFGVNTQQSSRFLDFLQTLRLRLFLASWPYMTQFQNLGAGPILTILWHFLPINFIVSISKDPHLLPSMTSDPLAPKWPLLTILIWRKRSEKGRFWPFFYVPILSHFA